MSSCPLDFEEQHDLVAHATSAAQHRLDRRVQGLDDAEAHGVVAVGLDAVDVLDQEGAELLHLRQSLPAQRLGPAVEKALDTPVSLVLPELVERAFPTVLLRAAMSTSLVPAPSIGSAAAAKS